MMSTRKGVFESFRETGKLEKTPLFPGKIHSLRHSACQSSFFCCEQQWKWPAFAAGCWTMWPWMSKMTELRMEKRWAQLLTSRHGAPRERWSDWKSVFYFNDPGSNCYCPWTGGLLCLSLLLFWRGQLRDSAMDGATACGTSKQGTIRWMECKRGVGLRTFSFERGPWWSDGDP